MAKKSTGFLLGAIIGGTVAAGAALLLAPTSGKKMRKQLITQLDDVSDGLASQCVQQAKETASDYHWVKETASQRMNQAKLTSQEALNQFMAKSDNISQEFSQTAANIPTMAVTEEVIPLTVTDVSDDLTDVVVVSDK
ncbi:hypothetical protein CBF34_01245 [Vagococcus penaei]|uniref:YtxH domain-containing protein n=1 Tax=Vagococcus penaei TaxID=633807 RepID=UPI0009868318|nr:YtxH domain-containing protein [Vagococcus penaei]RSU06738.1 hypothetical protein CBF34_01245 [Vagococcus penaei]